MQELTELYGDIKLFFEANIFYWYLFNFIIGACVASCIGLIVGRWPNKLRYDMKKSFIYYWEEEGFEKNNPVYKKVLKETEKKPDGFNYPPSRCDSCGEKLKFYHNIPIFGWIFLKGKCGFCKNKIPSIAVISEIVGGMLGVLVAWLVSDVSYFTFMWIVIVGFFASVTLLDWNTLNLPTDALNRFIWLILVCSFFMPQESLLLSPTNSLLGVIVGFSILLVLNKLIYSFNYIIYKFEKLIGKDPDGFVEQGFGEGDYHLLAALGVLLGWEKILITALLSVFVAIILFILVKIYEAIFNKDSDLQKTDVGTSGLVDLSESKLVEIEGKTAFPYGPSISLAALLTIILYKLDLIIVIKDLLLV